VSASGGAAPSHDGPIEELLDLSALSSVPYPIYRRLRDESPVFWSDRLNAWLVSRYADAKAVLEDPERFSSAGRA
jgi:cytochrome P450